MYDSLIEIKSAVNGVSEKQAHLSTQVTLALHKNDETVRAQAASSNRIDDVENEVGKLSETVSDLKRTAWLLTIIGGIVVAVVTSAASDWVSARVNPPAHTEQSSTTTEPPPKG